MHFSVSDQFQLLLARVARRSVRQVRGRLQRIQRPLWLCASPSSLEPRAFGACDGANRQLVKLGLISLAHRLELRDRIRRAVGSDNHDLCRLAYDFSKLRVQPLAVGVEGGKAVRKILCQRGGGEAGPLFVAHWPAARDVAPEVQLGHQHRLLSGEAGMQPRGLPPAQKRRVVRPAGAHDRSCVSREYPAREIE